MANAPTPTVDKADKPKPKVKILDINKLGMRRFKVKEMRRVKVIGPQVGKMAMEEVWVERELPQPILNDEEAALLVEADWKKSSGKLRRNGRYTCVFSGRRFFADNAPGEVGPKIPIEPVEDIELWTKDQLVAGVKELAAKAFFNHTKKTYNVKALTDFITSRDLANTILDKNNKPELIDVFNALMDKVRVEKAQ